MTNIIPGYYINQFEILRTLLFYILIVLTGCVQPRGNGEHDPEWVRIGVLEGPSKISMAGMMVDMDSADGRKIEYVIKNAPDLIISEMVNGTLEFAVLPTTSAALLYNRGVDYKLAGIPVWGSLWLAGTGKPVGRFKELTGQTIHVMGKGMTPDLLIRYLMEKHDLIEESDIRLNYSFPSPNELASMVQGGLVDLAVLSEPHLSMIIGKNPGINRILDLTSEWDAVSGREIPFAQTAFLVRGDFAVDNPDIVEEVQQKYRKSIEFLKIDPDSAARMLVRQRFFQNPQIAKQCLKNLRLDYIEGAGKAEDINRYLDVFYRMNPEITGGKIPDEKFYYKK